MSHDLEQLPDLDDVASGEETLDQESSIKWIQVVGFGYVWLLRLAWLRESQVWQRVQNHLVRHGSSTHH